MTLRGLVVLGVLGAHVAVAAPDPKPEPPHHHKPVLAVDVAACAVDVEPAPHEMTSLADVPRERGAALVQQQVFELHDAKHRAANEKRLVAMFPHDWKPTVELDATGMAHRIALELPGALTTEQLVEPVLAFVKAHPCLFGIDDPNNMSAHAYGSNVIIDRTPRSIGSIGVTIVPPKATNNSRTTLLFARHLWPVSEMHAGPDVKRSHARYLGRKFEQRKEMFGHDGGAPGIRVLHLEVTERDLRIEASPSLWCQEGSLYVMQTLYTELLGDANGDKVLAELPAPIDEVTGKPLPDAWITPHLVDAKRDWAPADRANAAGRACLGIHNEEP